MVLGRAVVEAALAAGRAVTTFRRGRSGEDVPGVETVRGDRTVRGDLADTWEWMRGAGGAVAHERSAEQDIEPEKEAAILGLWDARELDHCG